MSSEETKDKVVSENKQEGDADQAPAKRSVRKKEDKKTAKNSSPNEAEVSQEEGKPQKSKKRAKKEGTRKARKERQPLSAREIVGRIIPVLCLAAAFAGIVAVYHFLFPRVVESETQESASSASAGQGDAGTVVDQNAYAGVEDPWYASGTFTVGDEKLDKKIKAFCDGLSTPGSDPRTNAQVVFNNIVLSTYVDRGEDQKPAGPNWVMACAREFFSDDSTETGVTGVGDYYEFAAATAYVLRYFGYSDAIAVPVQVPTGTGETYGSAYCLVTDENGLACLCDPSMGTAGWMLDRYSHDVLVEDIGQDLSTVEAMGLSILRSSDSSDHSNSNNTAGNESTENGTTENKNETSTESTEGVATDQVVDYGGYGYDDYSAYDVSYDDYGYYA